MLARRAACWSALDGREREVRSRGRRCGPWGRSMAAASARGAPLGHSDGLAPRRGQRLGFRFEGLARYSAERRVPSTN